MNGYVIVATRAPDRWFDLDAVRVTPSRPREGTVRHAPSDDIDPGVKRGSRLGEFELNNPAGAPPLDWYLDDGTPERSPTMTPGTARFLLGDVFDKLATLEPDSVDLVLTSPPFLALRSYLPADHPDKDKEIGSEPTPAAFLDTLLHLVAALDRVLAPHGTLCVELGDTYAGGNGFDIDDPKSPHRNGQDSLIRGRKPKGGAWPPEKSLCLIPTLFAASLAYGRNLLTGEPSPAGQWRIRNVIPWARPNPPVGALGDKWRPATSHVTVACRARDRWFDLDAVRTEFRRPDIIERQYGGDTGYPSLKGPNRDRGDLGAGTFQSPHAGAPPLDWYDPAADHQPDDGLWVIPTEPYGGAHYATWPRELVRRLVECMCPREVCRECGKPRRRITTSEYEPHGERVDESKSVRGGGIHGEYLHDVAHGRTNGEHAQSMAHGRASLISTTLGWTDCGHDDYRRGVTLDPFVGSGTTLAVAVRCGRDAIGIDLDERNIALARQRLHPFGLDAPVVADQWPEDSLFGGVA